MPLVDRVVIDAPVPLNEEQVKILSAIRNPTAKIIVVEGSTMDRVCGCDRSTSTMYGRTTS
jgi:hypothetical protein